jgi:hypothetical protein
MKHHLLILIIVQIVIRESKVINAKVKGIILLKKTDPLYEKEFKLLEIKVSNDKIKVFREPELGIEDEHGLLFGIRESRLVYGQIFIKWGLFSKVLSYKDKESYYYFPYD